VVLEFHKHSILNVKDTTMSIFIPLIVESQMQVALLSRIHHRNLVPLIGYCEEEYQHILVYEYMHNGTLREYIHGLIPHPGAHLLTYL